MEKEEPDGILQFEILIEYLNMLLAVSVYLEEDKITERLEKLRRQIYYEDFDYAAVISELNEIKKKLNLNP